MKKTVMVICLLAIGYAVFAGVPGTWCNVSFCGQYAKGRCVGSDGGLGVDVAAYMFLPETNFGFGNHTTVTWDMDSAHATRLLISIGPVGTAVIAGGVNLFYGLGVATMVGPETQLGVSLDLGCRFRVVSASTGDFAVVLGAVGNWYFLHSYQKTNVGGFSGDITAYVGCSFGYDFFPASAYRPVYYV
ncbi:MAG: hypothetical protein WCR76_10025 [Sphaerochaetaceae bacterium]